MGRAFELDDWTLSGEREGEGRGKAASGGLTSQQRERLDGRMADRPLDPTTFGPGITSYGAWKS